MARDDGDRRRHEHPRRRRRGLLAERGCRTVETCSILPSVGAEDHSTTVARADGAVPETADDARVCPGSGQVRYSDMTTGGGNLNPPTSSWGAENGGDGSYDTVATDSTDHSLASAGRFSLDASAYPNGIYDVENGMGVRFSFTYAANSYARLAEVTLTWMPQ